MLVLPFFSSLITSQQNEITNWYPGSPSLQSVYPNGAECIISGYNPETQRGYLIGGTNTVSSKKPCNNKDYKYIYRYTLDASNRISFNKLSTLKDEVYSCNPKSIELDNKIYFINENINGYSKKFKLSVFDMNKEKYNKDIIKDNNLNNCMYKKPCMAGDNDRNMIYLVCGKYFYYYDINKGRFSKGNSLKYNHYESSCTYINNKFYVISGNSTSTVEYINTGNMNNKFNVIKNCLLQILGISLRNS